MITPYPYNPNGFPQKNQNFNSEKRFLTTYLFELAKKNSEFVRAFATRPHYDRCVVLCRPGKDALIVS